MKKSFGGLITFAVVFVILVIILSFIAISMNYTRAYRIKNALLTYIEQYEGYDGTVKDKIANYMKNGGFINDTNKLVCVADEEEVTECTYGGTFVYSVQKNDYSASYNSYIVRVGVVWNIPFISDGRWTISGETEQIHNFS